MGNDTSPTWQTNFKDWITRTAGSADDVVDAGIRRLRLRYGREGVPKIQAYMGYATPETIRMHGRILTNPPIEPDFHTERWWENLSKTLVRFASDEVPGVSVQATAHGIRGLAVSDAEGYFHLDLPRAVGADEVLFWSPAELQIVGQQAVSQDASTTPVDIMHVPNAAQFGIISDIDDTILHTGATDIATMAKLTFFGNARTRAPLDGVAKLYELMQHSGQISLHPLNPIFYISSSPWNLYDVLEDFLSLNAIPKGPLLLRDLGFDQNKFLKSGHDHKLVKARNLMELYSDLPFVLFGDSGQEDARLYATAAQEFGPRIKAIFIRDVDPGIDTAFDRQIDPYVATSNGAGVPMYLVQDSDEVARIAIDHGLLPPETLAEITAATARDRKRQGSVLQP